MLRRHDGGKLSAVAALVRRAWVPACIALATARCSSEPAGPGGGLGPPPVIADVATLALLAPPPDTIAAYVGLQSVIELRDSLHHRVPKGGVLITLSVVGGTALGATTAMTDLSGDAQFRDVQIVGPVGRHSLAFATPGVDTLFHPVVFTSGPPVNIEAIDSTTQSAPVGTTVAIAPGVRITDGFGSPVSGVAVSFEVWQGDGSVVGGVQVTDASGRAQVTSWTLGLQPGLNQLVAVAPMQAGFVSWTATGTVTTAAVITTPQRR
jgi:hypothetical protein